MKNKNVSIQEWIPIEKIEDDGILKLKNNKIVKIMKVVPINFNLKSDLEKNSILNWSIYEFIRFFASFLLIFRIFNG